MINVRERKSTRATSMRSGSSGAETVQKTTKGRLSRPLRTSMKFSLKEDLSDEENDNDMMLNDVELDARHNYIGHKEKAEMYTTDFDNLQIWYNMSPRWRRFTLQMIGILVFALLLHIFGFLVSLWMVANPMEVDPYVCDTESCQSISLWMRETMVESVDPCDDFYEFVCGKYRKEYEKSSGHLSTYQPLKTFKADWLEKDLFGRMFASSAEHSLYEQLHIFFRSCINYTARNEVGMGPFLKAMDEAGLNFDKPTLNLSEIAYKVWNLTSSLGIFDLYPFTNIELKTHVFRPLNDGDTTFSKIFKSILLDNNSVNEFEFIFQEVLRLGKISSVSGFELATAFLMLQNLLTKVKDEFESAYSAYDRNKTIPYLPDENISYNIEKEIFNCDVYARMMDPTFDVIDKTTIENNYLGMQPEYGQFRFSFANYMCNGRLIHDLNSEIDNQKDSLQKKKMKIDSKMTLKAFWVLWMYHHFYDFLAPRDKAYLGRSTVFESSSQLEPGTVCVLALNQYMPHLVINRMMKVVGVTKEYVNESIGIYKNISAHFREWLNDPKRNQTFGKIRLALFRDAINSYDNGIQTLNFSLIDLQRFGYNETAKLIKHGSFLENVMILTSMLANNDLNRWNFVPGFNPILEHADLYRVLKGVVNTLDHHEVGQNLTKYFIMPPWLFYPLYYNNDMIALQYGGIWAYFARNVVERWRGECINKKDFNLNDDEDNGFCSEIKSDAKTGRPAMQPLSLKTARNVNDTAFDLVFDLVMSIFKEAADKQKESKKFAFKTLVGFKNYTQEQLVFLKIVRHQCNSEKSIGTRFVVKDKMMSGLSQSTSFAKVWNCSKGSLMNAPKKCFTA